MQKKLLKRILAVILVLISAILPMNTVIAANGANNAEKVINALDIMETDKGNGSSPSAKVTRGQYAQMLVNMSSFKEKVTSESNVSLFNDVSKKYWAAGYIQTAINQGWMSGYLNGSFKPSQGITLIEAVNGVLKLLGYTNSDFTGSITAAEMALYDSKELDKNITKTKNQVLNRQDCMNLFYNTLTADTQDGKIYAETLGYKMDAEGEVDYLSLVNSNMEGPIVADDNWKQKIPFLLGPAAFYKDGTLGTISDIQKYDVIYYSKDLNSVWAYDNKVTGMIQSISPDRLAPTSVTIGGKEYTLGNTDMSTAFSSMGKVDTGDTVTLLLGKDDSVVDVLNINEYDASVTGIVIDTGEHITDNPNDDVYAANYITYVDANGNEYEQDYDYEAIIYSVGDLIRVTYEDGVGTIQKIDKNGSSFDNKTFSGDAAKVGAYELASNAKIVDYSNGCYVTVNPKRLSEVTLGGGSVYYYELNSSGDVSKMILNNVTGDIYQYGILTDIAEQSSSNVSYEYNLDGTVKTAVSKYHDLETGPEGFIFATDGSNEITDFMDLNEIKVQAIGTASVQDAAHKYLLADNVKVFYYKAGNYGVTTLEKVSDLKKYKLTAYYDREEALGGRVRVIVAEDIN